MFINCYHNKKIVIAGAANGIGAALSLRLKDTPCQIIALDQDLKALEKLDDQFVNSEATLTLLHHDIRDYKKTSQLGRMLYEHMHGVDILFSTLGVLGDLGPVCDIHPKSMHQVFDTNVMGNWYLLRTLDPLLKTSPNGQAVFILNEYQQHLPFWGVHQASNQALSSLIKTYEEEARTTHPHLCVKIINPGLIDTAFLRSAYPGGCTEETWKTPGQASEYIFDRLTTKQAAA